MDFSGHILLFLFGGTGVLLRYLCLETLERWVATPWTTWTVNMAGSFLIGCALSFVATSQSPRLVLLLTVGLLGGFTTFSSFSMESLLLVQRRDWSQAILYIFLSPAVGMAFAWVGLRLGKWASSV